MLRGVLADALDVDEALEVASAAERRFLDTEVLLELVSWPSWTEQHSRAMAILSSALHSVAALTDDESDLERLDRLLALVTKCRETLVPHFLATMSATDGPDYDHLRGKKAGTALDRGARAYPDLHLDEHLDRRLRHAHAHDDFDLVGDAVRTRFGDDGEVFIPVEEVIDSVLSHVELVVALYLGLSGAASTLNLDLPQSTHASPRDLAAALELAGSFITGAPVKVEITDRTALLVYRGAAEMFVPMAASAAGVLPERIEQLTGEITLPDGTLNTCTAHLPDFREYGDMNADTVDGLLEYARIHARVRIDGVTWLSPQAWVALARQLTTLAERMPVTERFRPVRRMRELARAARADEAVAFCTTWMRDSRTASQL